MSKSGDERGKQVPKVLDSASDDAGIQRILREVLEERSKKPVGSPSDGPMLPPWLEFPGYERFCLGWRIGPGEDYALAFVDFYGSLTEQERSSYAQRYPEPKEWSGYYEQLAGD